MKHMTVLPRNCHSKCKQPPPHIQVFSNDSATRTFLALIPDDGSQEIVRLIKRVDCVMLRHRLQQFYCNPVPHVSLLWWSGDMKEALKSHISALQQIWTSMVGPWYCQVGLVHHAQHFRLHVTSCSEAVKGYRWRRQCSHFCIRHSLCVSHSI